MRIAHSKSRQYVLLIASVVVCAASTLPLAAQNRQTETRTAPRAKHGGQMSRVGDYHLEVVYRAQETRIYMYDRQGLGQSMRGLECQVTMRVRDNPKSYRYATRYVAANDRSSQDYLAVKVNVGKIRDGDMQVVFYIQQLSAQAKGGLQFQQTFALTKTRPTVTVAAVTDRDRVAIAKQRTCPVTDVRLGDHGKPIKLMVGNQAVFVCCKGCIQALKKNPQRYVSRVTKKTARK